MSQLRQVRSHLQDVTQVHAAMLSACVITIFACVECPVSDSLLPSQMARLGPSSSIPLELEPSMLTLRENASNMVGYCNSSSMRSLRHVIQMAFFQCSPKCLYMGVPAYTVTKWHASAGQESYYYFFAPNTARNKQLEGTAPSLLRDIAHFGI